MSDNFSEIVYSFLRQRIPLVVSLLFIILFYMPLDLFEITGLRPQIGLICIYFWVQKSPNIFGAISAFILGFTIDLCSTTPLGVNSLLFMLYVFFLKAVFYYIKPSSFITDWLFFSLSEILVFLIKWLILVFYFREFLVISSIALNAFSTMMFYPLIVYINNYIRKNILLQEGFNG